MFDKLLGFVQASFIGDGVPSLTQQPFQISIFKKR